MKKLFSKIIVTAMMASMIIMPQNAFAEVTIDANLEEWGFSEYAGPNGINAICTVVDSEDSAHGEVLQVYASGNANRDNRYGGVEYELTLKPGTYRFQADFKCVEQIGTDIGRQVFTNLSTTKHGAAWGNLVTYPDAPSGWTNKSYTVTVSSEATYKMELGVAGNHCTWFDNVKVYDTSDATMTNLLPTSDFSTAVSDIPALAAPETVEISSHDYGEAVLTWSGVSNASSYKVYKSVDDSAMKEIAATAETSVTVTNTTGKNAYYVQAIGDGVSYSDGTYGYVTFEEAKSKAGLPDGYESVIINATKDIIFTYETVDGGSDGDKALKMTQRTPGTNGDNLGGIKQLIDPTKLIKGHTYYFSFKYKKESLNDSEYTKILVGMGNKRGDRRVAQASLGSSGSDWSDYSFNQTVCSDVNNFGIEISVNRNAAGYIDELVCYDMQDPNKTNLIENPSFEQRVGSKVADAKNIHLIQGVDEVTVKWDYPTDTIWGGAEIWNVTEDIEMSDPNNKTAVIEYSTASSQRMNVPVTFGEITKYRLILVDKYGNKSKGTDILVSGIDSEQNAYNFVQPEGWSITGDDGNLNAPMAVLIDKNYTTESDGALYVAQNKGDTTNFIRIHQQIEAEPSTTYVLSYDVKGYGASNIWRSKIVFAKDPWSGTKVAAFANVVKPYWQTKTMEYTTSESETSVSVNMIFQSKCELWFDNFKIYKKDDETQTNLITNGTFTVNSETQDVVDAFCTIVDDEYTYLSYGLAEDSKAESVLIESEDGSELYATVAANVCTVGEIDLDSLFAGGEIPKKLKLTVCDANGGKSDGVIVNTIPVTEVGKVKTANGIASVEVINQTEETLPLIMIAAAYSSEGQLLEVILGEQKYFAKQEMGESAYKAEVDLPTASENIKVMVFDTLAGMRPYF